MPKGFHKKTIAHKGDKGERDMTLEKYNYSPFWSIFEETFDALNSKQHGQKFPYADVFVDEKERKLYFEIALAGYMQEDLEIKVKDNKLSIICDSELEEEDKNYKYIERGIAKRKFKREWTLGPMVNTKSGDANFTDGILTISFDLENDDSTVIEIKEIKDTKKLK